jgi:RNA polymerase sigma-70 factor (ECF subfamily)
VGADENFLQFHMMDDRALLERLRSGDQEAYDAIVRAHYPHLVMFGEGLLRDRAAAEDSAQDVMLELWRRRAELVIHESLRGYLLRATRNRSLNQLRHAKVQQNAEPELIGEESIAATGATKLVAGELRDALSAAVLELPPGCREVFQLSRGRGLRYAEIASTLGISVKTVESQMGKALRHLRLRLAEWLPPGDTL